VRAHEASDADARLPMPPLEDWETFPFEGELRVRPLAPPVAEEKPRLGAGGIDCQRCALKDDEFIWTDEHWRLWSYSPPSGLPVVLILQPRLHCDLDTLPEERAVELGPLILRVERAVCAVGEIGRVHVCRWGDGSEHLHWWFMARPARMPQLIGSFAAIWTDILPPLPEEVWRANNAVVAREVARGGGTARVA